MPSLVHLGLGNFHRAHQAWYTHVANRDAADPWRITGVAMRSTGLRDEMAVGGWVYDLGVVGSDGLRVERIAVHDRVLVAAEDPAPVIDALAQPDVSAVTITVTEKGYGLNGAGRLNLEDPALQSDIERGTSNTLVGLLANGLMRRAKTGSAPIAILSCDNLAGNGGLLRRAMEDFLDAAGHARDALSNVHFPNTMVDRITPATTQDTRARMAVAAGRPVVAPVLTEAFSEWIIEDAGNTPLPDWTQAGAVFVPDVSPYERRKLLFLNAAHSALAYGGLLRGHDFVHEAVADQTLVRHIRALWDEATPLLPEFGPTELDAYTEALISRFSVAGMAHRLSQIAMDGSVKLPQRILPILRHHGFAAPAAARVVGDWWRVLVQRARTGASLNDPSEDTLRTIMTSGAPEKTRFLEAASHLGETPIDLPAEFIDACLTPDQGP